MSQHQKPSNKFKQNQLNELIRQINLYLFPQICEPVKLVQILPADAAANVELDANLVPVVAGIFIIVALMVLLDWRSVQLDNQK